MRTGRTFNKLIAVIVLIAATLIALISGVGVSYAATTRYSNVLDDLRKDENFDFNNYLNVDDDYSLNVIQIAESTDGELFVYVYQPAALTKPLTATFINMSLSESVGNTSLFNLTLLNREGVLGKYRVDGVKILNAAERYYNISTIYRDYDDSIDIGSSDESIITGKAYSVGKQYKAITQNGVISYFCKDTETIEIIDPFFDYLVYSNGFKFYTSSCHSHYIAFSTDKQIDTLTEATVTYCAQSYDSTGGSVSYGTKEQVTVDLFGTQKGGNSADGWFAKKYEWERIQSVDEFINSEDLKYATINNLRGKQWVLRFCETSYAKTTSTWVGAIAGEKKTLISDVTILRLKFVYAGHVYDLGAVSDIGHADNNAGNNNTNELASFGEIAFRFVSNTFKNISDWFSDMLGIPNWFGKVLAAILFIIIVIAVIVIIVMLIRFILQKIGSKPHTPRTRKRNTGKVKPRTSSTRKSRTRSKRK